MSENPCEQVIKEALDATHEWVEWWGRSRHPTSQLPINEEKESIVPTPKQDEAEQKANKAKEKWLKANEAMVDCIMKQS